MKNKKKLSTGIIINVKNNKRIMKYKIDKTKKGIKIQRIMNKLK